MTIQSTKQTTAIRKWIIPLELVSMRKLCFLKHCNSKSLIGSCNMSLSPKLQTTRKKFVIKRKAQIWVETVIYVLIGLALIGLVLGFVVPRINEAKDRLVVEQTIDSLNAVDEKINSALTAPGNVRRIDFTMKKGELYIKPEEDRIVFVFEGLGEAYSEPDSVIEFAKVEEVTRKMQKGYSIELTLNYAEEFDLRYENSGSEKKLTQSATPYKFSIINRGVDPEIGLVIIDIEEISGR